MIKFLVLMLKATVNHSPDLQLLFYSEREEISTCFQILDLNKNKITKLFSTLDLSAGFQIAQVKASKNDE
jgi:hypothetical protein